jgi:hemoglobin/transferrin/lactoferrin receptor protein
MDGVRMNNAIYRAGHLQNIITVDQSLLQRVELAFGPGSLMYGSDALGGVVNFTTINPMLSVSDNLRTDVHAFAKYASAATEIASHLDLNLGGKKFASLTSFTYSNFEDLKAGANPNKDNEYGSFNFRPYYQDNIDGVDTILINEDSTLQVATAYSQMDIMEKLLFQQSSYVSHMLNVQYSTSSDIPRYDRLTDPGADPGSLNQGDWYYGPQDRLLAVYDLNIISEGKVFNDLRLVASYQYIQESRHTRGFGGSDITHRVEDVSVIGLNLDLKKVAGKHQINYGTEMYLNDVTSTAEKQNIETGEISAASTRYPDGGSTMNNFGIYVSHILKFGEDKWALNDGIRFNASVLHAAFSDTSFYPFPFKEIDQHSGAITGSLGLVFNPDKTWRFALIGSTGYRTPNIDDLTKIFGSAPGTVIVPNPDLKPEYTYNADLNISKVIADKVQLEATAFYTMFSNILTVQPGTLNGEDSILYDGVLSQVQTTVNKSKAYLYGVNAGINADITDILSLTSTITYTYGRIETDTTPYPLDHIPPVYGRTSVNLQFNKLRTELYALYNGWKHIADYNLAGGEDNEQYATVDGMPSWYTLNLKAAYQFTDHLQVQAGCENMLDLNYRVFASGIAAPGRNIFVTLRGRF